MDNIMILDRIVLEYMEDGAVIILSKCNVTLGKKLDDMAHNQHKLFNSLIKMIA